MEHELTSPAPLDTFVNPLRVPCFRQVMLHALGGSTFMGCFRYYKSGSGFLAANSGIKSFAVLGITAWGICRFQVYQELLQAEELREKIERSQRQVQRQRPSSKNTV
jgi:hypothetical protein